MNNYSDSVLMATIWQIFIEHKGKAKECRYAGKKDGHHLEQIDALNKVT